MKKITSPDNEQIKKLHKLAAVKYRREYGQFLVENAVIIRDAYLAGHKFSQLFLTQSNFDSADKDMQKIFLDNDDKVFLINEKINKKFSQLTTAPGIGAVYEIPNTKFVTSDKVIYLNNVGVPGNVGSIMRSALAFGFKDIVLDEKCVDAYNPKVIQAAKESVLKLNILIDEGREIFNSLRGKMKIISTSLDARSDLSALKSIDKFCLVFGNESHGVDEDVLAISDKKIKISINKNIESLNVASTAAIIFYELSKN